MLPTLAPTPSLTLVRVLGPCAYEGATEQRRQLLPHRPPPGTSARSSVGAGVGAGAGASGNCLRRARGECREHPSLVPPPSCLAPLTSPSRAPRRQRASTAASPARAARSRAARA